MMVKGKRHKICQLVVATGLVLGGGRAFALDDVTGFWATEKRDSQIKITHCGSDAICGAIYWMKDPNDAKGNPKLDRENEDETKRKRTILGMQLISMTPDDEQWAGTVYNPQNGKTYSATLKLLNHNEVKIEGCVAYVLCGSQKWSREEPKVVTSAAAAPLHVTVPKATQPAVPGPKSALPVLAPKPTQ